MFDDFDSCVQRFFMIFHILRSKMEKAEKGWKRMEKDGKYLKILKKKKIRARLLEKTLIDNKNPSIYRSY